MDRREFIYTSAIATAGILVGTNANAASQKGNIIKLPKPNLKNDKPLMQCLKHRESNRNLSNKELDLNILSAILWAAWGVNRDNGKHVVPTANNKQQIVVYAVRGDGTWEYNPKDHSIKCVIEGDMRNKFDNSGLIILYAAPQNDKFAPLHVGSMYQNVGLMCASLNLANCVKHTKHDALDKELNLPQDYRSYIAHSIAEVKV